MYVPMIHLVWLKDNKVVNPPSERQMGRGRTGVTEQRTKDHTGRGSDIV